MKYKLSDCITIISGGTPKKSQESYWNGNIPWITVKDFNGKYVSTTTDSITLEGLKHSSANLTEDQDILISARGTVGKVLMVGAGYTFNQSIYCLRADRSVLVSDYLFYWLEKNVSLVKQGTHGSVFETITKDTFNHLIIDLPDLKEQYQIAHKLSMFDRKINLNEQINDNLLELINSIYSARQSSDAKKEKIHISDLFDTSSTTYRINEHSNEFVWHFSIPNFDQQRYPTIDSVKDIKSNKIIVKHFSVLVSKLNPTTRRIWAPSTDSFNKYSKVCSTEFVSISGNDITEQATIFAITRSDDFMKYLSSKATGSTNSRQRVKPIDIYSYTLPISKSTLSQIQKQLALLLQKLQSNQDEIITLIKLKQELLFKYF